MEQQWLSETTSENFYFSTFPGKSCDLRRHHTITGALAKLRFGSYMNFACRWVPDDRAVWLGMITSDTPGDGGRLLSRILELARKHSYHVIGEPTPLKPKDWSEDRPWSGESYHLVEWYRHHNFTFRTEGRVTLMCFPGSRIDAVFGQSKA